jgi:hypothetical protein
MDDTIVALAAILLPFLAAAALVATAPSLRAGVDRLRLVFNTLGLFVVVAGVTMGVGMIGWGLLAGDKEPLYLSLFPLVGAGFVYRLITRRHQTWYGALGFNDSSARWSSFRDETKRLWGLSAEPASSVAKDDQAASFGPGAIRSHHVTWSFGFGGIARSGSFEATAPRTSEPPIVFPTNLRLVVDRSSGVAFLEAFRREVFVSAGEGATLDAATDVPFLQLATGDRNVHGGYTVEVALRPERLVAGPFSGTIWIRVIDADPAVLSVPVEGAVE